MNPLLMEDIVDDLFNKLAIEDLKICRLVCQLWNTRIVAHLKKNWEDLKDIDLGSEKELISFNSTMNQSKDKLLFRRFNINFSLMQSADKLLTEYQPRYLHLFLNSRYSIRVEKLVSILAMCAPFIENLFISGFAYFSTFRPFQLPEEWLNFNFPQLKTIKSNFTCGTSPRDFLKIAYGNDLRTDICDDGLVNLIIQEIFERSPNLKSIENMILPKFPTFNQKSMTSGILEKLSLLAVRYLADIRFGQNHPSELIEMQNHGLKLKYLNIEYCTNFSDTENQLNDMIVIEKFLQGQSNTLEILMLTIQDDYQIRMPVFPKVRKFSLGICNYNSTSTNSQIDLTKQFPKLKAITLKVECKIFGNWNKIFCGSATKVKTIEIMNKYHYGPKEDYQELESFFPNIENLDIGIGYKNGTSYEPCRTAWTNSIKSIRISIWDNMKKRHHTNLSFFPEQILTLHLKILKSFKELQKIELINVSPKEYGSPHWYTDIKTLMSLENVKYVKLNNFKISNTNLDELRKMYILDYTPGKCKFLHVR